jgi:hypothetical protein
VKNGVGTHSFKEYLGKSPTTASINFKFGATASPKLLLGFDLSGMSAVAEDGYTTSKVSIINYDAMATYFPWERGAFLRAGVGLSRLTVDLQNVPVGGGLEASGTNSWGGGNLSVGAGYAFWIGKGFNLTLNLDFTAQSYAGGEERSGLIVIRKPTSSNYVALGIGFDWY